MLTKNLTTTQAREQLVSMLAGSPALPDADLDRLVAQAELEVGVFDLDSAAMAGWSMKAALVADAVNVGSDDQKTDRSQHFEHCQSMAALYFQRSRGGTVTTTKLRRSDVIG